nr:hypothetical protein Iba_chr12aCG6670 [Ipomoea batatas]
MVCTVQQHQEIALSLIHFVADHFSPDRTSHPPCRLFGSDSPSSPWLQNSTAFPLVGFTHNPLTVSPPQLHSLLPACRKYVSPPSTLSLKYISIVAIR